MDEAIKGYSGIKLNLSLHIVGRDRDCYHELSGVTVFCLNAGDVITMTRCEGADHDHLKVSGQFSEALKTEGNHQNLIIKALGALRDICSALPFYNISLEKNVPIASGLGGGSCDAAFVIRQAVKANNLDIKAKDLEDLLLSLGADMSVCYAQTSCLMEGIGEIITPLPPYPECHVLLVNPLIPISAAQVYRYFAEHRLGAYGDGVSPMSQGLGGDNWVAWLAKQRNDLQESAIALCPEIRDLLHALSRCSGCLLHRMSGSGATCFALFKTQEEALNAAKLIKQDYPDYWMMQARV